MLNIISLISGGVFGFGLALSGMVNPSKIIGFLDITGNWDPSLLFVMAGGVLVTIISFRFILNRPTPVFGGKLILPTKQDIDPQLLAGAGLFGIGWALGGFCPGPALSALAYGNEKVFIFVGAMIVGITLAKIGLRSLNPA
ncbi:hypothetical protein NBZ79_13440 [Sneathiella marina]|uniref:YeeE/YedE family protein n=1 Tax=Sneathiella marina TaxID=2950108 RepID=A0ABY4VZ79_9PROT|nr:DUF6691 family protein [Sneathiella marina]USG60180.1 hypothetical protein NBZ79_13440 [Sneathiella marina]